jgi:hypothetical protein
VTPNEATVVAMAAAHREGRIDAMLATIHPDVVWYPWSRPGLSVYRGHEGIRQMIADMRAANGIYGIDFDDVTETTPGQVTATGRIVREDNGGEASVEFAIEMRDGLVSEVEVHVSPSDDR